MADAAVGPAGGGGPEVAGIFTLLPFIRIQTMFRKRFMTSQARIRATIGTIAVIHEATIPMSKPAVVSGNLSLRGRTLAMAETTTAVDNTGLATRWDRTIRGRLTVTASRTIKAHPTIKARRTIRARQMGMVPTIKGPRTTALRLNNGFDA
jgi:hypothetical protein